MDGSYSVSYLKNFKSTEIYALAAFDLKRVGFGFDLSLDFRYSIYSLDVSFGPVSLNIYIDRA